MRLGIDLDNTIVSYDELFHRIALEQKLIPSSLPARKSAVKEHIQQQLGNDTWTRLQADVYGPRLEQAVPYPGVVDFFQHCRAAGFSPRIISHKSRFPALGKSHDLREAAFRWLDQQGWFSSSGVGLSRGDIEFHDTRAAKIQAIRDYDCTVFIDDLPEIFSADAFPKKTMRILFDPDNVHAPSPAWSAAANWSEIELMFFALKSA